MELIVLYFHIITKAAFFYSANQLFPNVVSFHVSSVDVVAFMSASSACFVVLHS